MNQLTYLEDLIACRVGLQHPGLQVTVVESQDQHYTLLFNKLEKQETVSATQLFKLRYEYQQSIHDGIDLVLLFGRGIRVHHSTPEAKIRAEFEKLGYTIEFC